MNDPAPGQIGYAFALPRVAARLARRKVRRAELSRWEAYGLGILVFGLSCVFTAQEILPFVRQSVLRVLFLVLLPFAIWLAYLVLYYLNYLAVAALRRLRLYSARSNNPFQHVIIMSLTTLIALHFLGDECAWMKSLGVFWLALVWLNFLSILVEKAAP